MKRNALSSTRSRLAAVLATAALSVGLAAPAAAQPTQSGLVNVVVSNNTVQVPIAVAANVCGLQVGILAQQLRQGPVDCRATANAVATRSNGGGGGGGGAQQGLVNLAITDNTIQVPVGIAANICGVQAAVLAQDLEQGEATCEAEGNAEAQS
jgi:ChpA-C